MSVGQHALEDGELAENRHPILFCCTHSTGEANTSIALAGELARRGVPDLWFASDENHRAAVEALADRSEVQFVSMGEVNPRLALTMLDDKTYGRIMQPSRTKALRARVRQLFDMEHHFARYRALAELVEKIQPSLMVINRFCFHAIQVALTFDVPYLITAPCLPSSLLEYDLPRDYPLPSSGLPRRMTRRQKLANWHFRLSQSTIPLSPTVLREAVKYSKSLTELGIDSRTCKTRTQNASAELLLCFSAPGLDYAFPVPDNLRLLGALIPPVRTDPRDGAALAWLDEQPSVVYVAFGSVTRLTAAHIHSMLDVVRRLGDRRHQVLWVLSEEQQQLLPDPAELPANLRVEAWIWSQHSVLAHPNVRAFFTHGGSNSFHEGVYFGKPLLVRPVCIDQYDHAVRALDTGLGLSVERPAALDADDVYDKLLRLLTEESFGERARHFAEVQRAAGGLTAAADLVLDHVTRD
ncbi:glycosyltransferase [Streptomyces sp. NPDC057555]|uniref:glycosyltransferase n=1 Tax=Streptomyces sp. NPDC057555 TaxID=3346166 RepID=UPI0036B0CF0E